MKTLLIVLALAHTAAAGGVDPSPRCTPSGAPIFEISLRTDGDTSTTIRGTTTLYANGAWTRTMVDRAKPPGAAPKTASGCLDKPGIAKITAALKTTTWILDPHYRSCRARLPDHTVYLVGGKQVFDARVCGADALDDASNKALAQILDVLRALPTDPPDLPF